MHRHRYFWQAAKPDGLRILPNETSIGPKIRSNPRGVFDKSVVSTPRVETLLPYFDTGLGEVLGFPRRNRDIDMEKSPEACKLDFEDLGMDDTRKYLKVVGGWRGANH